MKKIFKLFLEISILFLIPLSVNALTVNSVNTFTYSGQNHAWFSTSSGDGYCVQPGYSSAPAGSTLTYAGSVESVIKSGITCTIINMKAAGNTNEEIAIEIINMINFNYSGYPSCNLSSTSGNCNQTGNLSISGTADLNAILINGEKYFISSPISISKSGIIDEYTLTITSTNATVQSSAYVVTNVSYDETQKLDLTSSQTAETVYIKIPADSITSSFSISATVNAKKYLCTTSTKSGNVYAPSSSSYQRIVVVESSGGAQYLTKEATKNFNFNYGNLVIKKVDATTTSPIKGVTFKLYDADSNGDCTTNLSKPIFNSNSYGTLVTDNSGFITVENLAYGKYCLKEETTLSTYKKIASPIKITMDDEEKNITIENKEIKVKISKKAITGEDELAGAKIKITDEDGTLIKEFESTTTPWEAVFSNGTYILTETIAPYGYDPITNSFKFTIDEYGVITASEESSENDQYVITENNDNDYTITLKNAPAIITILKTDISNVEPLAGAKFIIKCDNGYTSDEFITTETALEFEVLEMLNATCTLTETDAPEGYKKLDKSLTFKINRNGDIDIVGTADKHFNVDGDDIIVFNGTFPETAAWTWIGTIIVGVGLVGTGIYLILKSKAYKK